MTVEEEDPKVLVLEWLVKFGTDWVPYATIRSRGMQFYVNDLTRRKYVMVRWASGAPESNGMADYRLTDKGLALINE